MYQIYGCKVVSGTSQNCVLEKVWESNFIY